MKILLEKTDETHSITMAEIISSLKYYGITAERKSIYSDIEREVLYRRLPNEKDKICEYIISKYKKVD